MNDIIITGAKENNLRNVSVRIRKKQITVFTGVSGSGKSSLVFDTIGAEAQRQLNESYDSFIRSRLPHYGQPDVEYIGNLNTAIIINQKKIGGNARSTVGTITDIGALLRLLFSRLGKPFVGYSMDFSFNNPNGMCPRCEGLGTVSQINVKKLLDKTKSLNEGAINFPSFQPGGWRWTRYVYSGYFDNDKQLKDYTKAEMDMLLHAEEHKPSKPGKKWGKTVLYEGVIPRIENGFLRKESKSNLTHAAALQAVIEKRICPACKGTRLKKEILTCRINGKNIAECSSMQIDSLIVFIEAIHAPHLRTVMDELLHKLKDLVSIGLDYLSPDRETSTLSGGESQRIKMVKHLGNSLVELLYIFDEPSTGLHPGDIDRLNNLMKQLRDKGNTVLIVEHDPDIIAIADNIVDMGPGAGVHGGQVVYQGDLPGLRSAKTVTADYWNQRRTINQNPRRPASYIKISNAKLHNLQNISVSIPEHMITVVTGVAGSGKSSLINGVLPRQHPHVRLIDQGVLRGSRRSHLASYTGIFSDIRSLFSDANAVTASLFSANADGACPVCKGLGTIIMDLAFMDEVEYACEECNGTGYRPETLQFLYKNKTIVDVLKMTVEESIAFFSDQGFTKLLSRIAMMGLGYITIGQPLNTFSGGERQRLKLAIEFGEEGQLYVFDEPTTGLHPHDISKLLKIFNELADGGNTVIIIEHNLDIISAADWIIDIGPGAGRYGGRIVFEGTVPQLLKNKESKTAVYLERYLQHQPVMKK